MLQTTNPKQNTKVVTLFPISKPSQQHLDSIFSSKAKQKPKNPPKPQKSQKTKICQKEQDLVLIQSLLGANLFWD